MTKLINSELIINPDESVYHLQLKNGDIAPRIITVGDPERVEAVVKHFDAISLTRSSREFKTVTGRIGNTELTVISTGIGTDNIDIVLNELQIVNSVDLSQRKPVENPPRLQVLRLGTSGALQANIPVDTLLLSQSAIGYDGLLGFYANTFEQPDLDMPKLPKPYWIDASADLLNQFQKLSSQKGITVSAAGFYAPQGRSVLLPPAYPNFTEKLSAVRLNGQPLTNLEMETAGIYGLAQLLEIEALSVNAILANRVTGAFSKKPKQVIDKMITEALTIFSAPH